MLSKVVAAIVLMLVIAFPPAATAQTRGNLFEVTARISANGALVGEPTLYVVAGAEVAMGLAEVGGYGLRLTVDEDSTRAGVEDPIKINSRIYFVNGSNWELIGSPSIRMAAGGTASHSVMGPTVYGNGGYSVQFTVRRTDRVVQLSEFSSVESCSLWQELAVDGPLDGVRIKGEGVRRVAAQTLPGDLPFCCTAGNMRCCSDLRGTCCNDGEGQECCT